METLRKNIENMAITERRITDGLDYYKLTMSQFIFNQEPDAVGTFTFKNRGAQRLLDYITPQQLQDRLDAIQRQGFTLEELDAIATITDSDDRRMFSDTFIQFLTDNELPDVAIDIIDDDLAVQTTGPWAMATFWETVIMSEVNQMYFENFAKENGLDLASLHAEGDRRLSEKIAMLQQSPDLKIAEFGTRRRFSADWQRHVIERLASECPQNLIGTSNVAFANQLGLKPIGTFAHELPMGYAGLADARGESIRDSHGNMLDEWYEYYGDELAIALSDTFSSDFFFSDFTMQRSTDYKGTRHDSGDPYEYADKTIAHYETMGVDSSTKTLLFSDGLTVDLVRKLHEYTRGRIQDAYGIGTNLTNDLGQTALNVVMKLTAIAEDHETQQVTTVKLSDDKGKHTGPKNKVQQYKTLFTAEGASHEQSYATI